MAKTLCEIDVLYKNSISKLSKKIRIDYSYKVIDKAQFVLEKTRKYLSNAQKEQVKEKIVAAQNEIEKINSDS